MATAWSGAAQRHIVDRGARTTLGNAIAVGRVARRLGVADVVLVTSRWHARRASRPRPRVPARLGCEAARRDLCGDGDAGSRAPRARCVDDRAAARARRRADPLGSAMRRSWIVGDRRSCRRRSGRRVRRRRRERGRSDGRLGRRFLQRGDRLEERARRASRRSSPTPRTSRRRASSPRPTDLRERTDTLVDDLAGSRRARHRLGRRGPELASTASRRRSRPRPSTIEDAAQGVSSIAELPSAITDDHGIAQRDRHGVLGDDADDRGRGRRRRARDGARRLARVRRPQLELRGARGRASSARPLILTRRRGSSR